MGTIPRGTPCLQDIQGILDTIDDRDLLAQLGNYRWTGRKGYTPESMWRAVLARYLLRLRYIRDLIAQLEASPALRHVCGFGDVVPSESTFSRFLARLVNHQDLVHQAVASAGASVGDVLIQLKQDGELPKGAPSPGRYVSIDSTDIPAYGNPRRDPPADPQALWGHRTAKSDGGEMFYGYKLHAVCDAYYGTPLAWSVLPANANDSPQLPPLVDQIAVSCPGASVRYLMADRGYDGMPNYQYLHDRRIFAVIHMRDTDHGEGLTDTKGRPKCLGNQPMEYVRTDRGKGHLFRCNPDNGCPLQHTAPWLGPRCNSEHYETWEGDGLRRIGRLPRASRRWARLYQHRTIVERMFSSLKRSRLLAQHSYLGIEKVSLHVSLSLLAYTGSMLARLRTGKYRDALDMAVRRPAEPWALAA